MKYKRMQPFRVRVPDMGYKSGEADAHPTNAGQHAFHHPNDVPDRATFDASATRPSLRGSADSPADGRDVLSTKRPAQMSRAARSQSPGCRHLCRGTPGE